MLAGEGFPLAIAKFLKKDFGKVKIFSDTSLVTIGAVFMLIFFGHWDWKMIGPGTLVSMFYVGFMVRVFSPRIGWLGSRPGSGGWTGYSFPGPSVRPGLPLRLSRLLSGPLTA